MEKRNEFYDMIKDKSFNYKIYGSKKSGYSVYINNQKIKLTGKVLEQAKDMIADYNLQLHKVGETKEISKQNVVNSDERRARLSLEKLESLVGFDNGKIKVLKYVGMIRNFHYYEVKCNRCDKVWEMQIENIKGGVGCNSCSNRKEDYSELMLKYNLSVDEIKSLSGRYDTMIYNSMIRGNVKVCSEWMNSKSAYMKYICSIGWNINSIIARIDKKDIFKPSNVVCLGKNGNEIKKLDVKEDIVDTNESEQYYHVEEDTVVVDLPDNDELSMVTDNNVNLCGKLINLLYCSFGLTALSVIGLIVVLLSQ